jgi:hypothetical protein
MFENEMKLYKSKLLEGGIDFEYKNGLISGSIAKFGKEINIQAIFSKDKGKGNCQKFVKDFRKDLKTRGLVLVSSEPISEIWKHICEKHEIKYYSYT